MKKIYILLISLISIYIHGKDNIEFALTTTQTSRMPLTIVALDTNNKELVPIANIIQKNLNFTNQFKVNIQVFPADIPNKKLLASIKDIYSNGTPLALCINNGKSNNIEWRLYDTMTGFMIEGKTYKKRGSINRAWAHGITDAIIKTLTGKDGSFSSRIAYCKETVTKKGKLARSLYVADFDGSNPELLIQDSTIIVAPRWNIDKNNPLIFYSEYTDTNVQLKSINMKKEATIASNLNGINMLANFSPDGKAVVYSASNGNGNCQLYYHTKGSLKSFTRNNGNNFSPIFLDNENICFCSDSQTGSPQIYIGNIITGHVQRITTGGYCSSPAYCPANNSIAYHSKINNIMQIFTYNRSTKTHTQLTKDSFNKHEASWSPCGSYLIYTQENPTSSRIVSLNTTTKDLHYLTSPHERCNYAHCSGKYMQFPTIV